MLVRLTKIFSTINAFLKDYYAHSSGCCTAGGLSVAQLNGQPFKKIEEK